MTASESQLSDWWRLIRQVPADRLSDSRGPLIGLNDVVDHYGFAPLSRISIDSTSLPAELPAEPLFKNLTSDFLPVLRYKLSDGAEVDVAVSWAERVMRYCEIWRHDLEKRMQTKTSSPADAVLFTLQIAAFMLDTYETTNDHRYLNLALKIRDMDWVATTRSISNGLRDADQDQFVAALFGVRIHLMCDRAVARLEGPTQ